LNNPKVWKHIIRGKSILRNLNKSWLLYFKNKKFCIYVNKKTFNKFCILAKKDLDFINLLYKKYQKKQNIAKLQENKYLEKLEKDVNNLIENMKKYI